ncbi:MAG: asparaginase [Acidimicrobiales bacterium]
MSAGGFAVTATRAGVVESVHRVHAVVADRYGRLQVWGDRRRPTIARSAIKSIQALPIVVSGAAAAFDLADHELALACASHSGESEHVVAVTAWLRRLGLSEEDLECGPDRPLGTSARRAFIAAGGELRPILNGCSGKHAGFLTVARHLGAPMAGYIDASSAVQRHVTATVGHLTGVDLATVPTGVDGCGIPVHVLPLERLAFAMARLVDPVDLDDDVAAATPRIVAAAQLAFWVAGPGRTESWVADHAVEPVVVKTGAEGVFMAALPERGLGLALKVDDGTPRASRAAVKRLLAELGALDDGRGGQPVAIVNKAGREVGELGVEMANPEQATLDRGQVPTLAEGRAPGRAGPLRPRWRQ